jgi:peroxiredoxin
VVVFTRANPLIKSATGAPVTTPGAYQPKANLLKVGTKAPNFTLKGVDGKSYSLAAQRGHLVVLEFFAVWCPHCQAESSVIRQIQAAYAPKGVRIWAILASPYGPNYDKSNGTDLTLATKDDLAWFRRTFHEDVPMLVDPKFSVMKQYGNNGYPGIFVIDRNGVIVSSTSGEESYSVLAKALDKGLKASAP